MAAFFGSATPFLSHPLTTTTTTHHISLSSPQTRPYPSAPHSPAPQSWVSVGTEQQKPIKPAADASTSSSTTIESTDWIASTLTRRFSLGAGLAWVGFLVIGVISERIKTRFGVEASQQAANTKDVEVEEEVTLPNGIRYCELRVRGGASPRPGDLVVINVKGIVKDNGQVFVDTFCGDDKKPLALVMGSRPYSKGLCDGVEFVLRSMKAGGKRRAIIPTSLGFGEKGADLGSGLQVPPSATLEYIIEVDSVSNAPAWS